MKKTMLLLFTTGLLLLASHLFALETSTPEAQGISSEAILDFVQSAEAQVDALHSFMLVRHGKIVAQGWWEPYNAASPHVLYSLSKSFTSTAIGLAIAEGRLSLDDTIISFFPEETPAEPSDNLKAMRVRDLLAMNSGHQLDTTGRLQSAQGTSWVKAFLALPVEFKPGTHFVYNSGASFMLSAIIQKVTGQTLLDYLTPRLFEPLGIAKPTWEVNPDGINMGGWGLKVKTEDIAKFGQLYLQKGLWEGKRILTEEWVAAASARQTSNGSSPNSDWEQGYGYQFWRCRHNFYRGDGAFGQYCIVMPEQDAVLAITGGVGDMQTPMNLAWDILLPAMSENPLPENQSAHKVLQEKLVSLKLKTVAGETTAPIAKKISGKTYSFDDNTQGLKTISFAFAKGKSTATVVDRNGERLVPVGYETWEKSVAPFLSAEPEPMAATGAWITPDTFQLKLAGCETPYIQVVTLKFQDKQLSMTSEFNVSFGQRQAAPLTAHQ